MVTRNKNPFKLAQIKRGMRHCKDSPRTLADISRQKINSREISIGKLKVKSKTPFLSLSLWSSLGSYLCFLCQSSAFSPLIFLADLVSTSPEFFISDGIGLLDCCLWLQFYKNIQLLDPRSKTLVSAPLNLNS